MRPKSQMDKIVKAILEFGGEWFDTIRLSNVTRIPESTVQIYVKKIIDNYSEYFETNKRVRPFQYRLKNPKDFLGRLEKDFIPISLRKTESI